MDGEIDLELYTIAIIRLNNAFKKLENDEPTDEIKTLLKESSDDLNKLYRSIVEDLNCEEVNINEYYLFFSNGKIVFPQYLEILKNIDNEKLDGEIDSLIKVFTNLNNIAKPFTTDEMMK